MKTFGTFLLLLLLAAPAAAQTATWAAEGGETHGVSVIKTSWRKYFYNPALDEDPLRGAREASQLERERKETLRTNAIRQQQGRERLPVPSRTLEERVYGKQVSGPSENFNYYAYEVKVLNTGKKKIKSLEWDYVVFDPATQREVGRHSFETKADIVLGKGKTLVGWSEMPPASVVDARKPEAGKRSDKESHAQFTERVDIRRVVYEDGAVWERKP